MDEIIMVPLANWIYLEMVTLYNFYEENKKDDESVEDFIQRINNYLAK